MRIPAFIFLSASFSLALGCSEQSLPVAADQAHPKGTWVSDQASLTITDSNATIQVLASDCVGSYGEIVLPIPKGDFSLPGTYTQLIGAYPGKLEYAAEYTGRLEENQLTLEITVATVRQPIGPFELRFGVDPSWPQCLYP